MSINPEKFTQKAAEALNNANTKAVQARNTTVSAERALLCMLDQFESVVMPTLKKLGVEPNVLRHQCEQKVKTEPTVTGDINEPVIDLELYRILEAADNERAVMGDEYVSTEHILLAMSRSSSKNW